MDLVSLAFAGSSGARVWVVGDAVLDEHWLQAWTYYWPNGYRSAEIVEP